MKYLRVDMAAQKASFSDGPEQYTTLGGRCLASILVNEDDRLPEMFYKEPLAPHNVVIKVTPEMMDPTFDF